MGMYTCVGAPGVQGFQSSRAGVADSRAPPSVGTGDGSHALQECVR